MPSARLPLLIRFTETLTVETKEYRISIFVLYPGEIRMAMTEYMIESKEGQRWMPWVRKIFESNQDVPPEQAARLVVLMSSGRADTLSGCYMPLIMMWKR